MPDYREGIARGTGLITTPAAAVRNDPGGDLSGANLTIAELQMDSAGNLRVNPEGQKKTYVMSFTDLALAATPTDVVELIGSAANTLKITRVELAFSDVTGAATIADVQLLTRSTLNTGGTQGTAPTMAPVDPNDPVIGTQATSAYNSANRASLGTLACVVRVQKINLISASLSVPAADSVIWTFGTEAGSKCPAIRGVNSLLAVGFNGSAVGTTPTLSGTIEFTSEPSTA